MSNFLAVATVTATLQRELQSVIGNDVSGATATMMRPDAKPGPGGVPPVGVNIFLYEIAPNAGLRNMDLPTRSGNGQTAVQRPTAALDLHYLLSFYGNDSNLEPQRVLGSVVRHLHSRPLLTRSMIQDAVTNSLPSLQLGNSNLADAVEPVRVSPLSLSLEELSKLWSIFFQTPYVLSTAYRASLVFIEEELAPVTPLPVRERQVFVVPFQQPFIESLDPQIVAVGATLTITGQNLRGDVTKIKFGDALVTPAAPDVSNERIKIALPGALQSGVRTAQVIHDFKFNTPEDHRGFESNVAPFILRPQIVLPIVKTTVPDPLGGPPLPALQLTSDVTIGKNQRVAVLLNSTAAVNPPAYSFLAPSRGADSTSVTIAIPGADAGQYFVRLQIDGAESSLDLDPGSSSFGPTVTLP
jgi:hypothetical protein